MTNSLLLELILTCCSSGISTAIAVSCDPSEGMLFIKDGEIVHAQSGGLKGEEALARMVSWEYCQFETLGYPPGVTATITRPWREVLDKASKAAESAKAAPAKKRLKVLVVDDSSMMRRAIADIVSAQPDMEVAATAANGEDALARIAEQKFDVITLDVNMPVMDGSTAIKHIMIKKPCPVVIISNTDRSAVGNIMDFLMLGAVDFVAKPVRGGNLALQADRIAGRIRTAATAGSSVITRFKAPSVKDRDEDSDATRTPVNRLVLILSGAGGHAEWFKIVCGLPENLETCVLVLQTMPPDFTEPLAEYTAARSMAAVRALSGEAAVLSGTCYIGSIDAPPSIKVVRDLKVLVEGDPLSPVPPDRGLDEFITALSETIPGGLQVLVLSGGGGNSIIGGLRRVKEKGGQVALQDGDACMVRTTLDEIRRHDISCEDLRVDAMIRKIVQYATGDDDAPSSGQDDDSGLDWLI